jgi:hypothetical protein
MTQTLAVLGARLHLEKASGFSVWALFLGALAVVAALIAALGSTPSLVLPQLVLGTVAVIVGRKAMKWDRDQTLGRLGMLLGIGSFAITVLYLSI